MQVETRRFTAATGWSAGLPVELDSNRSVVLAFGAPEFADAPDALRELRRAFPRAQILGCSTAGEILQDRIHDASIVAAVARFDAVEPRVVSTPIGAGPASFEAGRQLATQLSAPDLRAVFLLGEGLDVNGSELVRGLNAVLPRHVVVTGGLAADGDRFRRTWVYDGGEPAAHRAVALGLRGERVVVGHGSKGGWDIFGPERRVTRSEGNVLYELDGKPALKLYKEYLGDRAAGLPATALLFPLAVRAVHDEDKQLVRTVLSVDEGAQSITFAGDVPTGSLAQLMRANFDRLVSGASSAATLASTPGRDDEPVLAVAISCVGRRLVLGQRTEEEIEATLEVLPRRTRQIGFYSYGELSPYASGTCDLHNQTMTLTTFAEN
jgi:hypothetical protein